MKLVETYRSTDIEYGEHKGRMMFKAGNSYGFNIEAARGLIDKSWYKASFRTHYLTIRRNKTVAYMSTQVYSIGKYYDMTKTLNIAATPNWCIEVLNVAVF